MCAGDSGGRFLPALVVFTRAFWHPCRVLATRGGRVPGVVAALDPRLISVTPTGVGRAGIGRSVRETLAVGVGTFPGPLGRAGKWLALWADPLEGGVWRGPAG